MLDAYPDEQCLEIDRVADLVAAQGLSKLHRKGLWGERQGVYGCCVYSVHQGEEVLLSVAARAGLCPLGGRRW